MAVNISWDDDRHHIQVFSFVGDWTLPEYQEALQNSAHLLEETSQATRFIFDFSESAISSRGTIDLLRRIMQIALPVSVAKLVIVGRAGMPMKMFIDTLDSMRQGNERDYSIHHAESIQRARVIARG